MIFRDRIRQRSFFFEAFEPRIKEILSRYKEIKGNLDPPIDPFLIANISKCRVEPAPTNVSYEGFLIPTYNGFIIRYRENFLRIRKRLTICHEVAHTFFYDTSSLIPRKNMKHPKEEEICFNLARKLLVPEDPLRKAFTRLWSREDNFASLERLANLFMCSLEIMAYRLTTDTSLLKNEMVTFWRLKDTTNATRNVETTKSKNFSYEDFAKKSMFSPELETTFSPYRRTRYVYRNIWSHFMEKFLKGENPDPIVPLEWKRRIERKMNHEKISVYIEAKFWRKNYEQFKLDTQNNPKCYGVISIVRKIS